MRVVLLITRLIQGGAQLHVVALARRLASEPGFEPVIAAGPAEGPEGELFTAARAAGLDVVEIPHLVREIDPRADGRAFLEVRRLLRRLRPRVLHTHSAKAGWIGRVAARAERVPAIVHTIHGLPFHPGQARLQAQAYGLLERLVARGADRYVCVSESVRRRAVERGLIPAERACVIPCGVDAERWLAAPAREEARRRLGIDARARVVACVARLAPEKGHEVLVDAAAQDPSVQLWFVGDGPRRREVEEYAAACGVRSRLTITGIVPPEDVPVHVAAADVVALPSTREGLPLVLVEASMAGRPFVAFDVAGAADVIRAGGVGRLLPPGNGDAFGRVLREMLAFPMTVSNESRARVAERFDRGRLLGKVVALHRAISACGRGEDRYNRGAQ